MKLQGFQRAELRDGNDNIVQAGSYGKGTELANAQNTGWIDYVMNNLEVVYGLVNSNTIIVAAASNLPAKGDMTKLYITSGDGKYYRWNGTNYVAVSTLSTATMEEAANAAAVAATTKAVAAQAAAEQARDDAAATLVETRSALAQARQITFDIGTDGNVMYHVYEYTE